MRVNKGVYIILHVHPILVYFKYSFLLRSLKGSSAAAAIIFQSEKTKDAMQNRTKENSN